LREQAPRLAGRDPFPTAKDFKGDAGRAKFWGGELAALAMATVAAQYAIHQLAKKNDPDHKAFVWENEYGQRGAVDTTPIMRAMPWHDPNDKTRRYVNLGKRPLEMLRWVTDPMHNAESKMSRPAAAILKQITGMEGDFKQPWKMDHESFIESIPQRLGSVAREFLPFSVQGNQFALTLPMRKGMTKFKAQQAFQSVFEVAAEPGKLKSLLRGQPPSQGALEDMGSQISDAATRNGVDVDKVRRQALSVVRGHHYDLFLKAAQKGDLKKMDVEATALNRLQAEHFSESAERKGVELTDEQWKAVNESLDKAASAKP
jgi:hypothetical protein